LQVRELEGTRGDDNGVMKIVMLAAALVLGIAAGSFAQT
jgi:hypothetical protein